MIEDMSNDINISRVDSELKTILKIKSIWYFILHIKENEYTFQMDGQNSSRPRILLKLQLQGLHVLLRPW